jgi:hypothetical protein
MRAFLVQVGNDIYMQGDVGTAGYIEKVRLSRSGLLGQRWPFISF